MPQPLIAERPLLSHSAVMRALDDIEAPLVKAQTQALEAAKDRLLLTALPLVEAKDAAGISALTWNAQMTLQQPIYNIWAQGYDLGGLHMQQAVRLAIPRNERSQFRQIFSGVPDWGIGNKERYALAPDVISLLNSFLDLDPGRLIASAAQAAVLNRAIQLAGNFSTSQLNALKADLLAAILPQPATGTPISRDTLLQRIQATLSVGTQRADNIARTELTNAYNRGRVSMGLRSVLMEAFRFLAIADSRTTEICRSRDGMIIEATNTALLNANTPALHFRCRSTLSPVLPRVNRRHRAWMSDPTRRPQNRTLSDLLPGWTT